MGTMLRWSILSLITLSACSGPTAPSPVGPAGGNQSMTGTWTGTISDSSGSMMGSGAMGPTATGAWVVTQSGDRISGLLSGPGMMQGRVTMDGTISGHTGTFTITMPPGSMTGACSAVATGSFDMDDMMTEFHSQYTGSNTCTGPFTRGEMHLHR